MAHRRFGGFPPWGSFAISVGLLALAFTQIVRSHSEVLAGVIVGYLAAYWLPSSPERHASQPYIPPRSERSSLPPADEDPSGTDQLLPGPGGGVSGPGRSTIERTHRG